MIITVDLGSATEASEAAVNRILLQANQALQTLDGMAFCLHSETSHYCLLCKLDLATLDFIAFDQKMAPLLDRAEQWNTFLQKFIPLASANDIEALSATDADDADSFDETESEQPPMTGWNALRQMGNTTFA